MTEYVSQSTDGRTFGLTRNGDNIGKIAYKTWFTFNADIELAGGKNLHIGTKGFWGTTLELKDGEQVLMKLKMNWNGEVVLHTFFEDGEAGYIFKQKSILGKAFILTDKNNAELVVAQPDYNWTQMNYKYAIATSEAFEKLAHKEEILFSVVHLMNYYISSMTASVMLSTVTAATI